MKNKLIAVLLFLGVLIATHNASAFSLVDGIDACLASGNCTLCDGLRVVFNLGKFIFMSAAGLALLFGLWQALNMIISFGNAEAVRTAKSKIVNTVIAVFIILASYLLVGTFINVFSGNNFRSVYSGGSWWTGPTCETERPNVKVNNNTANTNNPTGGTGGTYTSGTYSTPTDHCGKYKTRGIFAEQCNDMSSALTAMVDCIYNNLTNNSTMFITSISHNNGFMNCKTNYKSICEHAQNSCHFGGNNPSATKSEAVDLGTELSGNELEAVLLGACKNYVGYYKINENWTHHHISDSTCNTY